MENDMQFDKSECQWQMSLSCEAKILEFEYSLEYGKSKTIAIATGKVTEVSELEFDSENIAYKFFVNHFENIELSILVCEESITQTSHIQTYSTNPVLLDDSTEHEFKHLQATLALNPQGFNTFKEFALSNDSFKLYLHIDGERLCVAFNNSNFGDSGLICDLPSFVLRMPKK